MPPRNDVAFRRIYVIQIGSSSGFTAREMPHEAAAYLFPNLPLPEGRSRAPQVSAGEVQRGPMQLCRCAAVGQRTSFSELRLDESAWMHCHALHLSRRSPSARADLPSDKGG